MLKTVNRTGGPVYCFVYRDSAARRIFSAYLRASLLAVELYLLVGDLPAYPDREDRCLAAQQVAVSERDVGLGTTLTPRLQARWAAPYHSASSSVWRTMAIEPMSELGYSSWEELGPKEANWRPDSLSTRSLGSPAATEATNERPRKIPSIRALTAVVTPRFINASVASVSGRKSATQLR